MAGERGAPVSWLVVRPGLGVFSADGFDVGSVEHVLGDEGADVFEGLVVDLAGRRKRFADADEVVGLYEHGAVLHRTAAQCADLPEPRPAPGVLAASGDEPPPGPLERRLHRAWELVSGKG